IRVTVTATNNAGSTSATSNPTATVTASGSAPTNTALPAITGTATQRSEHHTTKLTSPANPTSFAYQWQDCDTAGANCTPITGATRNSYSLPTRRSSDLIRVTVTATNNAGSTSATSNPTATVTASGSAPTNTALPAITGTATQ